MNYAIAIENHEKISQPEISLKFLGSRVQIGNKLFSSADYSQKFKKTDCYAKHFDDYVKIVAVEDDKFKCIVLKIIVLIENMAEIVGTTSKIVDISASFNLEKLVYVEINGREFLSKIPYDLSYK